MLLHFDRQVCFQALLGAAVGDTSSLLQSMHALPGHRSQWVLDHLLAKRNKGTQQRAVVHSSVQHRPHLPSMKIALEQDGQQSTAFTD